MHGARLRAAVGHGVKEVAHARVLRALLGRAEVVVHHFVHDAVGNASASIRDPAQATDQRNQGRPRTLLLTKQGVNCKTLALLPGDMQTVTTPCNSSVSFS